jgi:hypothetical protein
VGAVRVAARQRWGRFGLVATAVAVPADLLENVFLWRAVHGDGQVLVWADPFDAAAVAAVLKFGAYVPAVLVAAVGIARTLGRAGTSIHRALRPDDGMLLQPTAPLAARVSGKAGPGAPVEVPAVPPRQGIG